MVKIHGEYTMVNRRWCMAVNGKVEIGDEVEIPRPNGTFHYHTVVSIIARHGSIRVCEIEPCLYYKRLRGLVDPSPQPMAAEGGR